MPSPRFVATIAAFVIAVSLVPGDRPILAQAGPVDSAQLAAARELVGLMDLPRTAVAGLESSLPALQAAMPQAPEGFWSQFVALAKEDLPAFVDAITPIYAARFTRAELEDLIAFYRSPTGRRLIQLQPELIREGTVVGQQWGAKLGAEAARRVSQKPPPSTNR